MTIGIIPARMSASRFPGKPMRLIHGMPMIGHCYFRSKLSKRLDALYIATCDEEIRAYAENIGAPCIMTSPDHPSASDRIAEAMLVAERDTGKRHEIVVLIQGDEPMIYPDMIDAAIEGIEAHPDVPVVNLVAPILTVEEFEDPNEVKAVVDRNGFALYFSREPIPSRRKGISDVPMRKQVCIIPYRRDYLIEFNETPRTPLETIEGIDMNRALECGKRVLMVPTERETYSVDTQEDLDFVVERMKNDPLMAGYLKTTTA